MYHHPPSGPSLTPHSNQKAPLQHHEASWNNTIEGSKHIPDDETTLFGFVTSASVDHGSLGQDWALIEVVYSQFQSVNVFSDGSTGSDQVRSTVPTPNRLGSEYVQLRDVVDSLPSGLPRSPVIALTGRSGTRHGTISGTSVSMMLPGALKMQEVWSVHLDGPIGITPSLHALIVY